MKRERFEKRLFRIFAEAGYSPDPDTHGDAGGNGGDTGDHGAEYPGRPLCAEQGAVRKEHCPQGESRGCPAAGDGKGGTLI